MSTKARRKGIVDWLRFCFSCFVVYITDIIIIRKKNKKKTTKDFMEGKDIKKIK